MIGFVFAFSAMLLTLRNGAAWLLSRALTRVTGFPWCTPWQPPARY